MPSRNHDVLILLKFTAALLTCIPNVSDQGTVSMVIVLRCHRMLHGAIVMKRRTSTFLISVLGMSVLMGGTAWAQAQSQSTQSTSSMPSTQNQSASGTPSTSPTGNSNNSSGTDSATFNTAQGQVIVNSTVPPAPAAGSPPSFEQLANGKKYISKDDANAYPPLANDFLYASHNGSRISKTQYENWVKHLN
jgi:hypothetical protein